MKTYVLDAFLRDTPGAAEVDDLLREAMRGRARALMSAVNYGEVYGKILRDIGRELAVTTVQAVKPLAIEMVDVTPQRACQAADVKVKYKLYYADSFAAALAIEHKATLVTGDNDFRRLGRDFPVLWLKS
jgi:predicted nucleic acid-binding protein